MSPEKDDPKPPPPRLRQAHGGSQNQPEEDNLTLAGHSPVKLGVQQQKTGGVNNGEPESGDLRDRAVFHSRSGNEVGETDGDRSGAGEHGVIEVDL